MAIRFKNVDSSIGLITVAFDEVTGHVVGVFNSAQGRTGVMASQLANLAGLMSGSHQLISSRIGTIDVVLANLAALIQSDASPGSGFQFPAGASTPSAQALTGVSTFHNMSLYWGEASGSMTNEAMVRFRTSSPVGAWRQGLSMWFDPRTFSAGGQKEPSTPGTVPFNNQQYRGSLVRLQPNTTYDVEVMTQASGNRRKATGQFTTWNENYNVASTVQVANRSTTLNITNGGTPGNYVRYAPSGGGGVINTTNDNGIALDASYIILDSLTLLNCRVRGISLSPNCHDVLIDGNDISQIGFQSGPGGFAAGTTYCIATNNNLWPSNQNVKRIVIQNNQFHHPKFDSNNWDEDRTELPSNFHPEGVVAVFTKDTGGNNVFRYNKVYSNSNQGLNFEDGFGGGQNFGPYGTLTKDSDIYGNEISECNDDCLEIEGGNMNVRIFDNHVSFGFCLISQAAVPMGPSYVFSNVLHNTRRSPANPTNGSMYKLYGKTNGAGSNPGTPVHVGGGRVYLLHNTCVTSIQNPFLSLEMGFVNIVSRNNVYHAAGQMNSTVNSYMAYYTPGRAMWSGSPLDGFLDFDYDIYSGSGWNVGNNPNGTGREANGSTVAPTFESNAGFISGIYSLAASSSGRNAGVTIPNFNDLFVTPDCGAIERGQPATIYGPR